MPSNWIQNTQCAQILQLALLPRSWNPPHSQSFPCHYLHVQANQAFWNFTQSSWSDCQQWNSLTSRHQKFGHHSQSEFSRRRHKSRPQENQQVTFLLFYESSENKTIIKEFLPKRYFTLTSFETLPERMFSAGKKSLKIGFVFNAWS